MIHNQSASRLTIRGTHAVHRRSPGCRREPLARPSLQSSTGSSTPFIDGSLTQLSLAGPATGGLSSRWGRHTRSWGDWWGLPAAQHVQHRSGQRGGEDGPWGGRACRPACGPAAVESPDQDDDGAPGRVQCEHHGDTPAVKVENVADDGIQREVEGGDHRLLLRLDHRGQQPPLDPAARDRGRRQDLSGRVVERLRQSPQGLHTRRGRGRHARPIRGPPPRHRGGQQPSTRPQPGHRDLIPVHRRRRDDARRRAEPPARPGGAPPGQ